MIKPALTFPLYIEGKRCWTVMIFKTRGHLRQSIERNYPDTVMGFDKTYAFTDGTRKEISFCLWTCTDNNVAHECWHAIAWWIKAVGISAENSISWYGEEHERVAEAHGNLVSQFWKRFCAAGLQRSQCWGFGNTKIKQTS